MASSSKLIKPWLDYKLPQNLSSIRFSKKKLKIATNFQHFEITSAWYPVSTIAWENHWMQVWVLRTVTCSALSHWESLVQSCRSCWKCQGELERTRPHRLRVHRMSRGYTAQFLFHCSMLKLHFWISRCSLPHPLHKFLCCRFWNHKRFEKQAESNMLCNCPPQIEVE